MIAAAEDDHWSSATPRDVCPADHSRAHRSTRRRRASTSGRNVIGRFKLLQEIGEGGFGSVWMAEQKEPVKRKVALKIIKLGMDTEAGRGPLRSRASGPGADGPPQHRQGARRRRDRDAVAPTS